MLNLKLRDEFLGPQMPGTAIALRGRTIRGGTADPGLHPFDYLPHGGRADALRAVSTDRPKRPIVLMGDRGRGKSHIMAYAPRGPIPLPG